MGTRWMKRNYVCKLANPSSLPLDLSIQWTMVGGHVVRHNSREWNCELYTFYCNSHTRFLGWTKSKAMINWECAIWVRDETPPWAMAHNFWGGGQFHRFVSYHGGNLWPIGQWCMREPRTLILIGHQTQNHQWRTGKSQLHPSSVSSQMHSTQSLGLKEYAYRT